MSSENDQIVSKIPENIFILNDDMWWSKDDVGAYQYLVDTNRDFVQRVRPFLDKTEVCIQAGGHCGWMIRELDKIFDYTYTFEPNPLEFTALCMNMPQPNIFKFNACVGNERKLVSMHHTPTQSGDGHINGEGRIPVLMIDDLNVKPDFIQLDLEGYEYFALLGAEKTIAESRPVLCIERYWGHRFGVTNEMLDEFLSKHNYKIIDQIGSDHFYKV